MDLKKENSFPLAAVQRLPNYLRYVHQLKNQGVVNVSSVQIAKQMNLTPPLVKKDLQLTLHEEGKPKIGYNVKSLIIGIENFLDYDNTKDAIIVGIGQLGKALIGYKGFSNYGYNIVAGFDKDERLVNKEVEGIKIFPLEKLPDLVERLKVNIGIISVPKEHAQEIADLMIKAGIKGIWNWAPHYLEVDSDIVVKNEDMAASLAILANKLKESIKKGK